MKRLFPTMSGMDSPRRTRTSLAAAALIALCAGLWLPGCAPHRRGRLPAGDGAAPPPARERVVPPPTQERPVPPVTWQDIDRSQAAAEQVCDMAMSFLGTPYRFGGASPSGFDCSGLVHYVYREVGVDLPRNSRDQSRAGSAATLRTMLRGDLIFFKIDRDIVSHVGIYVGRGEFVHAPGTGKYIRVDSIDNPWWRKRVKAVRRVFETPPLAG